MALLDMADNNAPFYRTDNAIELLDFADEVLNKIILCLSARERVPLGNSCRRLKTLVFEDPILLKHLDFSKKGSLVTMKQIAQYFNNKDACQRIIKITARNVECMKAGDCLKNSIGRAINLVELNIHGTKFKNIRQLGFLHPLRQLKILSLDWPNTTDTDISLCKMMLGESFSRLKHLSVRFEGSGSAMLKGSLSMCQKLEELCIETFDYFTLTYCESWDNNIKQLKDLKIIRYYGYEAISVLNDLESVLPDPKRWTDFSLCGAADTERFWIEKDVEVCEELMQSSRLPKILNTAPWEGFKLGSALDSQSLLKEVLRMTNRDVPEDLCCLSMTPCHQHHLLKVEEAKLLLKDPRCQQISYLYLDQELERRCDAHLLVSALPNLSELVLTAVSINYERLPDDEEVPSCPRWDCIPVPENMASSFELLVANTPQLRHFKLGEYNCCEAEHWDFDAMDIISNWPNLETLELHDIPCSDNSRFWIEIGKRCKNLDKIYLKYACDSELFGMLEYCCNLRDVSVWCITLDQAEMFALLARNVRLERVNVHSGDPEHSASCWVASLQNMIHQCAKLTTIICDTRFKTEDDCNEAVSAVKRIKGEFRRHDFEIKLTYAIDEPYMEKVVGTTSEDSPLPLVERYSSFPSNLLER